ncbi:MULTISPECIES: hypothetical protein [Vibrio]|uniref:Uncharacterized protein n=1 Tax=Vibrio cortegadensis TaxID=1328770 RepID=A0ABV4M9T9_9VIBR|nr:MULTISPECIES: hypothetical protein [Vibrio]MDN3696435.1 hypothetical protein [Vibrio cortegadensis]NOH85104.1 hypothetical protein [Vibrio sp. 03-59-1]RBW67055.1 hypothetical protein DS893_00850 [Vibrionales bacterium C3R12]TKF21295.1 hypothetical protein FCV43_11340 [Vibrio genomosp. F6]
MADQNVAQILTAFSKIEAQLTAQNRTLSELAGKVDKLEKQNIQLVKMIQEKTHLDKSMQQLDGEGKVEVTRRLKVLEDKSKKIIDMLQAGGIGGKKRAWP